MNITYHTPCSDPTEESPEVSMIGQGNNIWQASETFSTPNHDLFWKRTTAQEPSDEGPEIAVEDALTTERAFEASSTHPFMRTNDRESKGTFDPQPVELENPSFSTLGNRLNGGIVEISETASATSVPSLDETFDSLSIDALPISTQELPVRRLEEETPPRRPTAERHIDEYEELEHQTHQEEPVDPESWKQTLTGIFSIRDNANVDILSISEDASESTVPLSVFLATAEKAVIEAMTLSNKDEDESLDLITQQVAESYIFSLVQEDRMVFLDALEMVLFSYEQQGLLDKAWIANRLMELGFAGIPGSSISRDYLRCIVQKAQILRKQRKFELSEVAYRQAIEGFKDLKETKCRLKCQVQLGNFLRTLNRDSEALCLLVDTLLGHFNSKTTRLQQTEIIAAIQNLHYKMNESGEMKHVISSFHRLVRLSHPSHDPGTKLLNWRTSPEYFNIWAEFANLGSGYSNLEMFSIADLCFAFPHPEIQSGPSGLSQLKRIPSIQKEICEHYRRQGKIVGSLEQLKVAFDCMLPLVERYQYSQASVDIAVHELRQILKESEPQERFFNARPFKRSPTLTAWFRAQDAYKQFGRKIAYRERFPMRISGISLIEEEITISRNGDTASLLSHDSSMFSVGSLGSKLGVTYSVGSLSSLVSNSGFMLP
jgi:tetratricopeptide (TPR) repeat protein